MLSDTLSLGFGYVTVAKLDDLQTNPLVKRRRPKTVIEQKETTLLLCYEYIIYLSSVIPQLLLLYPIKINAKSGIFLSFII